MSRWVLKGSAWKRYGGNPGLGKANRAKVEPRDEVYKSIKELDPGLDGYWSKMVEKYLGSPGVGTDGEQYLAAAKRYAESEPEEWRRISPLVPLRYLGDKVSDYPSRRALQLWFASPAGNETPVKVVAYNWSRTHRYVMAKALRFLTGGDWARDYLADGHDGLARDIAEFVEKVRRREESVKSDESDSKVRQKSDKSRTKDGASDDFWREDEEDEERIAGVTRDEDWVRSDYVDSLDYDDGNEDDDGDDDEASSALGRRHHARRTRAMHGLMKEIDASSAPKTRTTWTRRSTLSPEMSSKRRRRGWCAPTPNASPLAGAASTTGSSKISAATCRLNRWTSSTTATGGAAGSRRHSRRAGGCRRRRGRGPGCVGCSTRSSRRRRPSATPGKPKTRRGRRDAFEPAGD